jgi:hypothetical protein
VQQSSRLGDAAHVGHGDECHQLPEIHRHSSSSEPGLGISQRGITAVSPYRSKMSLE